VVSVTAPYCRILGFLNRKITFHNFIKPEVTDDKFRYLKFVLRISVMAVWLTVLRRGGAQVTVH
jgi:hypothetical protein